MRTALIVITAISVISLIAHGLIFSSSSTAGTESSRLSKAEFIVKADDICKNYYEKASPDANLGARNLYGQAKVIGKVMPQFNQTVRKLKTLKPPAADESAIAIYVSSLDRSSDLVESMRESARRSKIDELKTFSQDALEEALNQKMIAARYGFKVCSVASSTTVKVPGSVNPRVAATRA